jgi:hypothetical protein
MSSRARRAFAVVVAVASAASLGGLIAGTADAAQTAQNRIVSAGPAAYTPHVLDGQVDSIAQVGGLIVLGGTFTRVRNASGSTQYVRQHVLAFNASNGALTSFNPPTDGEVTKVLSAGDGKTVYIGGNFKTVRGYARPGLARVRLSDGALIGGFAPNLDGGVTDLRLFGGRLWVAGKFSRVGSVTQPALATLNPANGAYVPFLKLRFAEPQDGAPLQVSKMDVNPAGTRLAVVGSFNTIDGYSRPQIALLSTSGSQAGLANWATDFYNEACDDEFPSIMRSVGFSPDGGYFVVVTTGGPRGPGTPCDESARWEAGAAGGALRPSWVDYTGGDTAYSVAVTGTAIYVGGHFRWENNPNGNNAQAEGAVSRPGIAALDPLNGLPFTWNPTRNPLGVGVLDMLATPTGLWVASDTDRIANQYHARIAFMPLSGGAAVRAAGAPGLPAKVYKQGGANAGASTSFTFTGSKVTKTMAGLGGINWSTARGTFMLNGQIYIGQSNGALVRRVFTGKVYGSPVPVTGADRVVADANWHQDVQSITSMFFFQGRLYYTLSGDSRLYYRYFTAQSDVVGAERFEAGTSSAFAQAKSGFYAGGRYCYSVSTDANLRCLSVSYGSVTSGIAVVSGPGIDGRNWQSSAMFAFQS